MAIGYVRVSTGRQAESGLGLHAQRTAIRAECDRRQWGLSKIYEDAGVSGAKDEREGLEAALAFCAAMPGATLVVAKVDRLARSVVGFANVLGRLQEIGSPLVALDLGVDTSTATGKMVAQVVAVIAEFERDLICDRTRSALEAKRARGERLGPRPNEDPAAIQIIKKGRHDGLGYRRIAKGLNNAKIPAPRGGEWKHSSVRYMAIRLGIEEGGAPE